LQLYQGRLCPALFLQYVNREKQQRIARNQQPLVVMVDQPQYGADVRHVPERHEQSDQRKDENYKAEQTGFSTWRFYDFPLFVV